MAKQGCNCQKQADQSSFDAQQAFDNLSHKYRELALLTARYMSEAKLERPQRVQNAGSMAREIERIVGGAPTKAFPECCLIGHHTARGFQFFCTGVLVHPRIVLTAGHCNIPPQGESVPRINAVALNVSSEDDLTAGEIISVKTRTTHPNYIKTQELDDITVLILGKEAKTAPAGIATKQELSQAQDVQLVGFGNSDFNSTVGFGLKRTVSVLFDALKRKNEDLSAAEQEFGFDADLEFVAGGGGRDSCNGDSGGPAYIVAGGVTKVAGLTSRAAANAKHPCGDSGIYTRVDANLDFVHKVATRAGIQL